LTTRTAEPGSHQDQDPRQGHVAEGRPGTGRGGGGCRFVWTSKVRPSRFRTLAGPEEQGPGWAASGRPCPGVTDGIFRVSKKTGVTGAGAGMGSRASEPYFSPHGRGVGAAQVIPQIDAEIVKPGTRPKGGESKRSADDPPEGWGVQAQRGQTGDPSGGWGVRASRGQK